MKTTTFGNYIDGEFVDSKSGRTFPNINPANVDEVVGNFQASNEADVEAACSAAVAAQEEWAAMPATKRGEYLFTAADLLTERLTQLGEEMTREEGKTLPEAIGEVTRAINIFRYFGGEGARQFTYNVPSERPQVVCYTIRKPLGTVALITPWNFPSAIPAWKIAPALIAGNTVVIKPASLAPLSSFRLVEALHEAKIPKGVINYITGSGGSVGDALTNHPSIRGISFTGSTSVGDGLYRKVSDRKLRVQLEMGGKNPTIVLRDSDLNYAADILVNGAFFSTGQKCTACSRAIIERPIYEALVQLLLEKTRALKIGNGLNAGVQIGPAVDSNQLETDLEYIRIAKEEGAELLCGGNRLSGGDYDKGYFIEPAIFTGVTPNMRIAQEEVFGPVLALMVAEDFENAMEIANGVRFGLSASIVSRDLTRVHQFIERIEAGLITVNLPTAGVEYQLPFGGTKESSYGMREQGPQAIEFYSETRTVYLRYAQ
ncbi:MAG TPA: aldehyde dehydrogenase family protein [Pyrinomonadaceae bacterium]|nr:aldehyde dehydrogenase family protein [Pyrinomonadaceae bacterium]